MFVSVGSFTTKGNSPEVLFLCHETEQVPAYANLCSAELIADLKQAFPNYIILLAHSSSGHRSLGGTPRGI